MFNFLNLVILSNNKLISESLVDEFLDDFGIESYSLCE